MENKLEESIQTIIRYVIENTPPNSLIGLERDTALQKIDEIKDVMVKVILEHYKSKIKENLNQ